jgi:predicted nicotinamide N-methyase
MDFDPLSLFTPDTVEAHEPAQMSRGLRTPCDLEPVESTAEIDDEPDGGIIHILDLPVLNRNIPREVLITILQLLKPHQETNFGPGREDEEETNMESMLLFKEIELKDYKSTQNWLETNGYIKLSEGLSTIRFTPYFFQYVNRILSSSFSSDEEVIQLASLRISENCGRTARPNFQRKIIINGFHQSILLNEPALTSDSLGLKTWGSSLVLSELIVEEHESLIFGPVLELGAGTGLVGITIGLLGYSVTLTDLPEILPNLEKNVSLNGLESNVDCHVLDWTDPSSFVSEKREVRYNTIVVADPIYSPDHPRWVVNMMLKFLEKSSDAKVLLQIPIRKMFEGEREVLWKLLEEENLEIVDDRLMDGYDDFGAQQFIYRELRWKTLYYNVPQKRDNECKRDRRDRARYHS